MLGLLKHHRAVDRGEDPPAVDVGHEDRPRSSVLRHGHIHQIRVAEVELGDAPSALEDYRIVARSEAVIGGADLLAEVSTSYGAEVLVGILVPYRTAVEDDLRGLVGAGLEQQGVHIRMAGDARSLGLYGLRPP